MQTPSPIPSAAPAPSPAGGSVVAPPPKSAARALRIVRWVLPVALFAISVFIEWNEHIRVDGETISPSFYSETILFGLIGPTVVFITLTWVVRVIDGYVRTSDQLADANRDLEVKVDQRTHNLQAATDQLARANEELASANEELRELDRLKSEFVSLVSHQLRAPLTNIRGALELVTADGALLPTAARRPLAILDDEAEHLTGLVTKILDVSRLEAGHLSVSPGAVAVEPLLARTCSATLGPRDSSAWTLAAEPGLPPAWADESLAEEVIRNLLDNAREHAPGGPVDVRARLAGGMVAITVEDHGPGIPVGEQARIFDSFHRIGDRDTTTRGYGLGLYFVERLTTAMGGTVAVASPIRPDPAAPGTRFTVTLPVAPDEPPGADDEPGAH